MTTPFTPAIALHLGEPMPGFTLPDTSNTIVRLKSYKQRRPALVALLHSTSCPYCRQWLAQMVEARDELAYREVEPLLIFPDDVATLRALKEELELPGALLSDPERETLSRYVCLEESVTHQPTLLVAVGRYNDCLDAWLADEPAQWPPLAEPLATFAFAEQDDCACGLPIWQDTY